MKFIPTNELEMLECEEVFEDIYIAALSELSPDDLFDSDFQEDCEYCDFQEELDSLGCENCGYGRNV